MHYMVIRSIAVKKYRYHTDTIQKERGKNILDRNFSISDINQKWCAESHMVKDAPSVGL
ncbi:hypothetical protein [Aminobacterium colombiense]|uniref:hypothetical protein n=1 Tax=Aminobacterium colombiense TaxID=81468 RepID=UPI00145EBFE1|nr:hypothetical protein [Aminobacterium colombiense]